MIFKSQHTIQQLCFEVDFPDKIDVSRYQNKLSYLTNNEMSSIFDTVFTKYTGNKMVAIEKVEIDLGIISKEDFNTKFLTILESRMNELFSDFGSGSSFSSPEFTDVKIKKYDEHFVQYFIHYITYGFLPWNVNERWLSDKFFNDQFRALLDEKSTSLGDMIPSLKSKIIRDRVVHILEKRVQTDFVKQMMPGSEYEILCNVFDKLNVLIVRTISISETIKSQFTNLFHAYLLRILYQKQVLLLKIDMKVAVMEFVNFISEDIRIDSGQWVSPIINNENNLGLEFKDILTILKTNYLHGGDEKLFKGKEIFAEFNEVRFIHWININYPEIADDIIVYIKKIIEKAGRLFPSLQQENVARIVWLQVAEYLKESARDTMVIDGLESENTKILEKLLALPKGSLVSIDGSEYDSGFEGDSESRRRHDRVMIHHFLKLGMQVLTININVSRDKLQKIILSYAKVYPHDFQALLTTEVVLSPLVFWHVRSVFTDKGYDEFVKLLVSEMHKKLSMEPYEKLLIRHVARNGYVSWTAINQSTKPVFELLQQYLQKSEVSFVNLLKEENLQNTAIEKIIAQLKKSILSSPAENKINIIDKLAMQLMDFLSGKCSISDFGNKDYFYKIILQAIREMPVETAGLLLSLSRADVTRLTADLTFEQKDVMSRFVQKYTQLFQVSAETEPVKSEERLQHLSVPIYVFNAGLVLLGPFLTRLFDKAELLQDKNFKTEQHRQKAMLLLHYLATKHQQWSEHELVLNKIITGLQPDAPVELNMSICEEEMELCDGLLDAVIRNWSALKNTSSENLRASFLLREGRVVFEQEGWRLTLEQKTYDILIDMLPWGYSLMKYPWMKYPIYTEWR